MAQCEEYEREGRCKLLGDVQCRGCGKTLCLRHAIFERGTMASPGTVGHYCFDCYQAFFVREDRPVRRLPEDDL